ncbi:exoribonuclease R [Brachyspira hampsonii 30446]|uniref:Exoribonuclease R n=1 Tax=Brachyspira hampsonii 30446 TaxID=1289135 RepID=A0A2U4EZQ0_9SPIR|nr:RNB domain-containing ribonuclease [Brachyspira hampsonii]EKV57202.1 exoribonuclease R [Brachyspira hampsonii 30446]MBW5393727.1 RNB domain-containing ribonuclease [Brachyspira hampsonii]OEJ19889.1 exoribonuclease R [Brachyspira hampsonii]
MKTAEELIKKLMKNQMDYNIFIKFNSKTAIEKTSLTNLIRKAISDGYIQKTDGNLLKVTKEGRQYINKLEGKEEAPKTVKSIRVNVNPKDAKTDSEIIARAYNIKLNFSEELLKLAEEINSKFNLENIESNIESDRKDFRNIKTVTIDSETSKDLDDAFSIEKIDDNNYKVYIHISDVSHFIELDSPLDLEARKRGNSTYLIDNVYNMFPEVLSNNIISLNENDNRFALTIIADINDDKGVLSSSVCKSVIKSDRKLSYNYAEKLLKREEEDEKWLLELLDNALNIKNILYKKRKEGRGVEFDNQDIKIILNDEGIPIEFYAEEKKESMSIVEELMLLCNSEIAKKLSNYDGVIYRYHGLPDEYRFNNFKILAHTKGYELKQNPDKSYDIKGFIDNIKGKPEENLLVQVLLRSMTPSSYSIINKSHFGLGLDYYTYFTSPIRRYADLLVHRIVKDTILSNSDSADEKLKEVSKNSVESLSLLDKNSKKAERYLIQIKAARYMKDRLGDEYYGIISSMSPKGIYVEIEGLEIEGFIEATYIGSNYRFYQDMQAVYVDKLKAYELGDRVKVLVASANTENGKIFFSL